MKAMSKDIRILLKYTLIWVANHALVAAVWYFGKLELNMLMNYMDWLLGNIATIAMLVEVSLWHYWKKRCGTMKNPFAAEAAMER